MSKTKATQFRMSKREREFLSELGKGNLTLGLREAMKISGFKKVKPTNKNYNCGDTTLGEVIERLSNLEDEIDRYMFILSTGVGKW